jgi:hypothetical protein
MRRLHIIGIKHYTQNRTEQNRTEQNRTEQNRTEQNRTEQNRKDYSYNKTGLETKDRMEWNSKSFCNYCFLTIFLILDNPKLDA